MLFNHADASKFSIAHTFHEINQKDISIQISKHLVENTFLKDYETASSVACSLVGLGVSSIESVKNIYKVQ